MADQPRIKFGELEYDDDGLMCLHGRPFTGIEISTYADGSRGREEAYVDGQLDGMTRRWHSNGQLASEARYWQNMRHGKACEWRADGTLVFEELCELDVIIEVRHFADDGTVTRTWTIDPNHTLLAEYRTRHGKAAPPL